MPLYNLFLYLTQLLNPVRHMLLRGPTCILNSQTSLTTQTAYHAHPELELVFQLFIMCSFIGFVSWQRRQGRWLQPNQGLQTRRGRHTTPSIWLNRETHKQATTAGRKLPMQPGRRQTLNAVLSQHKQLSRKLTRISDWLNLKSLASR